MQKKKVKTMMPANEVREDLKRIQHHLNEANTLFRKVMTGNAYNHESIDELVFDFVIKQAQEKFRISKRNLLEKTDNETANLRASCYFTLRKYTHFSLANIGAKFGGYERETVRHGVDVIKDMLKYPNTTLKEFIGKHGDIEIEVEKYVEKIINNK